MTTPSTVTRSTMTKPRYVCPFCNKAYDEYDDVKRCARENHIPVHGDVEVRLADPAQVQSTIDRLERMMRDLETQRPKITWRAGRTGSEES